MTFKRSPIDINLHFEDGVFVDKDAQAKQDMLIVQQGMMPKVEFLQRDYGLSEEDAKRWVQDAQDDVANDDVFCQITKKACLVTVEAMNSYGYHGRRYASAS